VIDSSDPRARALIAALFFLSGACTLVYQIVWVRMLVLVFGMTVFAVSTVLTAFMAGLALGSAWFGRLADRRGNGLRTYAWLELGIGLFALAFPLVLAEMDELYTLIYRQLDGSGYAFALIRFLLGFVVLLVPTTLMGATLPVLSKAVVRQLGEVGWTVGGLYAVNTFGAAIGCFVVAFVLMERLGVQGTIWATAAANLAIALAAYLLSRGRPPAEPPVEVRPDEPDDTAADAPSPRLVRLVFWGFALSGFVALGYEVIWTRLLTMTLKLTTTQSLSTILVTFLLGLAAGGAIAARFVDRFKGRVAAFGVIELLLGLFGLVSMAAIGAIPSIVATLGPVYSWWGHLTRLFVVAFAVMFVPTFLMGMLLPIVGKLRVLGLGSLGRRIGDVYAVNTAGAIFGAFVAGFVLIPFLGTQAGLQLLAGLNLALGAVVLFLASYPSRGLRWMLLGGLGLPALLLVLLLPGDLFGGLFERSQAGADLLFYEEATGGTVTVYEYPDGQRLLKVNGAGEVPTDQKAIRTFRLLGSLPLVLHDDAQDVLVIAFGGGVTLRSVELHRPQRIDCVEVVPGVVRAAPYIARYNGTIYERLEQAPFDLVIDDGRHHVLRTDRRYDVIISDSTHPATTDSWVLYTREFYELCARRLKPGGYIAQWLPLHGLAAEDYQLILRIFRSVYPHASLWMTRGYTVMLGAPERLRLDLARIGERLADDPVRRSLAEVGLDDPVSYIATLTLAEEEFANFAGEGPINTDDRPIIGFADRRRSGSVTGLPAMMSLVPYLGRPLGVALLNADASTIGRLARRSRARRHFFMADIALALGDRRRAAAELRRALALDSAEPESLELRDELERQAAAKRGED